MFAHTILRIMVYYDFVDTKNFFDKEMFRVNFVHNNNL